MFFGQEFAFTKDAMEALCSAEPALRSHADAARLFTDCRTQLSVEKDDFRAQPHSLPSAFPTESIRYSFFRLHML